VSRQALMGGALVAGWLLTWDCAAAQPLSDAEKIERLERQSELLQKQLDRQNELIRQLQREVSRSRRPTDKKETEVAKRSEPLVNRTQDETRLATRSEPTVFSTEPARPSSPPTNAEILRGNAPAVPITLPQYAGVKFTFWGWLEAATIFRQHNQVTAK
jgi:hypothetical protein